MYTTLKAALLDSDGAKSCYIPKDLLHGVKCDCHYGVECDRNKNAIGGPLYYGNLQSGNTDQQLIIISGVALQGL